ncbi:MAG: bifunctional aspartate transaminase/aspartate 4-decarboxylase [Pseudomonadota bacterium]
MSTKHTENLSPFELKDVLINMASSHHERMMLNAGRGNPNFLATQPRHAFLRIGDFALQESERSYNYLSAGFGGLPEKKGIVNRFDTYAQINASAPGICFLQSVLSFADDHLGINKADLLHEMTEAFLGCNYPVPPKMLSLCKEIVKVYLGYQLCGSREKLSDFDVFATEGGTAAMTYIFESLQCNQLLRKKDKIALITPIFSPYLEIPHLPAYDLEVVYIKAEESQQWQVPSSELEKLLDPQIKMLFMVNPTNPTSVKMSDAFLNNLSQLVAEKRKDLMIVTDDVYGTFADNFRSVFAVCPYNTLCVYSFSKYFGATGWRLGAIMLHKNNVFDQLIKALPESSTEILNQRYASLTNEPQQLAFIDRMVADSRSVALNHTAGVSLPQQLQMTLFAVGDILDESQQYQAEAKRLIRRRYHILYEAIGYVAESDANAVDYYTMIDLEQLCLAVHNKAFSDWVMQNYGGAKFIMRLADETSVVLLPGKGFEVDHPSARVSLANLKEYDYRAIGFAVRKIIAELKEEYSAAAK